MVSFLLPVSVAKSLGRGQGMRWVHPAFASSLRQMGQPLSVEELQAVFRKWVGREDCQILKRSKYLLSICYVSYTRLRLCREQKDRLLPLWD